jgi:hypothetical protein
MSACGPNVYSAFGFAADIAEDQPDKTALPYSERILKVRCMA